MNHNLYFTIPKYSTQRIGEKMKNELAYFTDSVNRLIEGRLIMVDKNIASVLKCVATVPALCKCVADTVRTTSYVTEFSRARVSWTRPDGTVESRLKLPVERNRLFAFVVCLLTEVDSGRRGFLEFLKEYYHEHDTNIGYEKFANEVLKPFKQAGEIILRTVDPDSLNVENSMRAERYYNAEKIYISSEATESLLQQLATVTEIVCHDPQAEGYRDEVMQAVEYFTNALHLKNPRILGASWLALKSLMRLYNISDLCLQSMLRTMSFLESVN